MNEPDIAAPLVRQLVDALAARGIDREELLARAGAPRGLGRERSRLPFPLIERLLEAAEALSGDDRVGFHSAELPPLDLTGWTGPLLVASDTLRSACRQAGRFMPLWSTAWHVSASEGAGRVRCELEIRRPERRGLVHLRELLLAHGLLLARHLTARPLRVLEVRLTHARRGDRSEYEAFFGGPVRFEAGRTSVTLASAGLDDPLPTASRPLFELFERKAAEELSELSRPRAVGERVRSLLEEELEVEGLAGSSLAVAARRLHTSERTLQRTLRDEGTSNAGELDAVRRRAAVRLLLAGVHIAEVSWRLGYAEPPVFHRAFKRWTGQTPDGFRRGGGASGRSEEERAALEAMRPLRSSPGARGQPPARGLAR